MKEKRSLISVVVLVLLIIVIFLFGYYLFNNPELSKYVQDPGFVTGFVDSFGIWGFLVFLALVTLEVIIAPIPPFILYVVGGLLFGGLFGGILALVGNVIGSVIAFFIARNLGREYVVKKINEKSREKFDKFFEKHGGLSIFLLRINPFTSTDLFSYMAGLTSMSYRNFILGTALGLAPLVFVQTFIGGQLIAQSHLFFNLFIVLSLLYLVIFFWLIIVAGKNKSKIKVE